MATDWRLIRSTTFLTNDPKSVARKSAFSRTAHLHLDWTPLLPPPPPLPPTSDRAGAAMVLVSFVTVNMIEYLSAPPPSEDDKSEGRGVEGWEWEDIGGDTSHKRRHCRAEDL